jgi:hypothetical protein
MVRWLQSSWALNSWLGPRFRSLFPRWYDVEHHFRGLLEKVHRPPEDSETFRFQTAHQVLPGIPFLQKLKLIVILYALAKVATLSSVLRLMEPIRETIAYDRSMRFLEKTSIRIMTGITKV